MTKYTYKNTTLYEIKFILPTGELIVVRPNRLVTIDFPYEYPGLILQDTQYFYNPNADVEQLNTTYVNYATFNPIVEQLNTNDTTDVTVYNTLVSVSGNLYSEIISVSGNLKTEIESITGGSVVDGNSILSSSLSGSIYRTQQERNSDFINVKDFGAVGDGITDDTAAIQNACTAVPFNGATIIIPIGRYKITENISIKPGTRIIGCGLQSFNENSLFSIGSSFICYGDNIDFFTSGGTTSLYHYGIEMSNINFISLSNINTKLLKIQLMNRWTIRNCSFRGAKYGLYINSLGDIVSGGDAAWGMVEQCIFKNVDFGIYSPDLSAGNQASYLIIGGDYEANNTSIYIGNRQPQTRVIGVKFDNNKGIVCNGYANEIIGNTFEGCNPSVTINTSGTHQNSGWQNIIQGNNFTGRYGTEIGVLLNENTHENILIGNRFSNLNTKVSDLSDGTTLRIDNFAFEWPVSDGAIKFAGTHYINRWLNIKGTSPVFCGIINTTPNTGKEWRIRSDNDGTLNFYNETDLKHGVKITPQGSLLLTKQDSEPTTPPNNTAILYIKNDGLGKTQLCIKYSSGTSQILTTES